MGLNRLILANQLIGRQAIGYVLDELEAHPEFEFYCLVDSPAGVAMLAEAAAGRTLQAPINLLLEGGMVGRRSGCRDLDAALTVARAAKAAGWPLRLVGVEGFEGLFSGTLEQAAADGRRFVDFLVQIAQACVGEDLFAPGPVILSAGGSMFYDLVVEGFAAAQLGRETRIVTRSGCYLTHDSGMYERSFEALLQRSPSLGALGEGLRPALEVWGYVQSRPEATKAICTVGRRDISSDVDMPTALHWCRPGRDDRPRQLGSGHVVTGLNDQHTHLALPADSPLQVGDMVGFGVSHPCTTFDKWQVLYLVDDAYKVIGAVKTFF
jgi:D-serine dehydratase